MFFFVVGLGMFKMLVNVIGNASSNRLCVRVYISLTCYFYVSGGAVCL